MIIINRRLVGVFSRTLRITGMAAGVGLVIASPSFFLLGGLAVLSDGPFAYTGDVDFHIGVGVGGFPGFILYAIWSIVLGCRLLRTGDV